MIPIRRWTTCVWLQCCYGDLRRPGSVSALIYSETETLSSLEAMLTRTALIIGDTGEIGVVAAAEDAA